jgi:hypothetical protein
MGFKTSRKSGLEKQQKLTNKCVCNLLIPDKYNDKKQMNER